MGSFIFLVLVLLSTLFVYKKRFTSGVKIGGLYLVQLYYLFATPIIALLMFDIGSGIFSRPEIGNLPVAGNILFNLFNFSVMLAVVGMGIHSTSTSVYQSFKDKDKLEKEAYHTNELFHIIWSHKMIYLGSIFSILLLGLLELNHPYFGRIFNFNFLLIGGIILGITGAVGILRAAPIDIGYEILASALSSLFLGYSIRTYALNVNSYPMTFISLASIVTLFITLSLAALIFAISETLSKKVVKRAFPKGHPFHKNIDLTVLKFKIEQNLSKEEKEFLSDRESKLYS